MWKSFCGNTEETHDNLKNAIKRVFDYVTEKLNEGTISYQELETWIWVQKVNSGLPIMFYDLRDTAVDSGWIKNGKWVS
jgi:hypothetical protein